MGILLRDARPMVFLRENHRRGVAHTRTHPQNDPGSEAEENTAARTLTRSLHLTRMRALINEEIIASYKKATANANFPNEKQQLLELQTNTISPSATFSSHFSSSCESAIENCFDTEVG